MQELSLRNLGRLSDLGAPTSLSDLYLQIRNEQIRKEKLAEKILAGKRLNKAEKEEIYRLLTGKEPAPVKKGRPSTEDRDFKLALDYIHMKAGAKRIDKLRNELAKKHKLRLNSDGVVRENTFYRALNRGIENIYFTATLWLENYKKGEFSDRDPDDNEKTAAMINEGLRKILDYKAKSNRLQKMNTK